MCAFQCNALTVLAKNSAVTVLVSFFFFEYQVILLYTITQNKNLLVVEMVVQCLARGILFQAINSCTDISSLSINFAGRPHRHVP